MIQELSGNTHRVYTANIVVFNSQPAIRYEWVSKGEVTFGHIDNDIIR